MNVTIKLVKHISNYERREILIEGKVSDPIDPATAQMIAGTMFEVEYAINEHLPHIRCHISTSEEV